MIEDVAASYGFDIPEDHIERLTPGSVEGLARYVQGRLGSERRWIVGYADRGWLYSDTPDGSGFSGEIENPAPWTAARSPC